MLENNSKINIQRENNWKARIKLLYRIWGNAIYVVSIKTHKKIVKMIEIDTIFSSQSGIYTPVLSKKLSF